MTTKSCFEFTISRQVVLLVPGKQIQVFGTSTFRQFVKGVYKIWRKESVRYHLLAKNR